MKELIELVAKHAQENGVTSTQMSGFGLFKTTKPSHCDANLYKPSVILGLQGTKQLNLYGQSYALAAEYCLITSVDMPIISRITEASKEKPYLSVVFELDMTMVADVLSHIATKQLPTTQAQAVTISKVSKELLECVARLIHLLDTPQDIAVLYPLLQREIIYRLLISEQGARLRELCVQDSASYKVFAAINHLNQHFEQSLRVEHLAQQVNMSVSSLHHHFKAITGITPLQFQKQLRLQHARRQIFQNVDIAVAAYQVGYESASQFSREYTRLFGLPPSKDRSVHA